MSIIGLTDTPIIRRDGKIRAGYKETKNGKEVPVNTDYFVLADAPQLVPVLGEKPKEIYFTVAFDDLNAIAYNDLRWYQATELACRGNGKDAGYFGTGELAGVQQKPAEMREKDAFGREQIIPIYKARARVCQYKQCPEYVANKCSEFIRLGMVIPQFNMGSWFDFENTSINGILNIMGAFRKGQLANMHKGGKISGEIFRLYKEKDSLPYENANTGKKGRSDRDVVHMEHVQFEEYAKLFKDKCPTGSWDALMALRGATLIVPSAGFALTAPSEVPQIAHQQQPSLPAPEASNDDIVLARANHEGVAKLFGEISALVGKENTEAIRVATARNFPDVQRLADYLKAKIAEIKKKVAPAGATVIPPTVAKAVSQEATPGHIPQGNVPATNGQAAQLW